MAQAVGELIGTGATADVHAWAPGQVIKLFRADVAPMFAAHEANMTRVVFQAGGPAPAVIDTIMVAGRAGIILPRLDGQTLMQMARADAITAGEAGHMLAALALATHGTPAPPQVPSLEAALAGLLRRHHDRVPADIAAGVLGHLRRLSAGTALCHGDLHPGNVIMTGAGPRLIDWLGAIRAAAGFDLALSQVTMTELAPHLVADPQRLRTLSAAFQSAYAAGAVPDLATSIAAHLPVARLFALLTGSWPAQRAGLLDRIAADLQQAG